MAKAKKAVPENPSDEQVELSKAELEKRREEITAYYKENIKHLTVQREYEEVLRDIEKIRAERVQAQMFLAQAMAPKDENGNVPGQAEQDFAAAQAGADFDADQVPKRTLKRTE